MFLKTGEPIPTLLGFDKVEIAPDTLLSSCIYCAEKWPFSELKCLEDQHYSYEQLLLNCCAAIDAHLDVNLIPSIFLHSTHHAGCPLSQLLIKWVNTAKLNCPLA